MARLWWSLRNGVEEGRSKRRCRWGGSGSGVAFLCVGRSIVSRHRGVNRRMLLLELATQAALDALHRPLVGIVGRTGRAG